MHIFWVCIRGITICHKILICYFLKKTLFSFFQSSSQKTGVAESRFSKWRRERTSWKLIFRKWKIFKRDGKEAASTEEKIELKTSCESAKLKFIFHSENYFYRFSKLRKPWIQHQNKKWNSLCRTGK